LASRPIALHCESESHLISIEKAVPLGLIVNECVTNATKHAFPDERPGTISVRLIRVGDTYTLTITDNGIGTKAHVAHAGTGSRLIQMLAAQLGSTIEIEPRSPGTAVIVTIPVKSAK
jgi:two-component sensor histidine kinase